MDAGTAPPHSAARHLQLDSPMRPQVIKFCYRKRPTGHSRSGKDDSSQDPKTQSPSSPLRRQSLSTPAIPTYHAEGFYEIDHERLPPRTPIHLKSIHVVKVSEYTSLGITVSFPSLMALQSFFSSFPAPSDRPELDERFVMSSNHAARILRRRVAEQELQGEMHQDSFWFVNPCLYDFSASSHPATLPDALSSPEAPPAQPKAPAPVSCLLDTLKFDGAGWGVRRRVRYIGRPRHASKEASIGGYETEASVKEQLPPAPEDKRSSISGKRKRDGAETSNDKPSTERRAKKKTYRSPKKQKKRHVESKDGDPRRGKDRWSAERYAAAERSLLEIMRSTSARIGAPVMRQALREEARKRIGDTSLLDHLLKHMAGRVPDGSTERLRRRHKTDGAMEYWLEPADLAEVRREAGVSDPYWVTPPGWKPGDDVSPAAGDLMIKRQAEELTEELKELNDVKRHMEQLSSNMVELGKEAKSEAERAYSKGKRPQVIKFCYRKRPTGHSRNGKGDSSQDPKTQSPSSPLSRQSLSTPAIPTYHAGGFYEIDHERLPPRTPIHLKSIRVVKVSEYTSLGITVSFPSLMALRSFFSSFPAPSDGPELDERFVMSSNHAARILRRWVAEQELQGEMHQDNFWVVNPCLYDFSASSHPATLPDALSSPEAPPAQPKAPAPISCLLDTLKFDGAGWGLRRCIASKEASIDSYETEAEQQPPTPKNKRSSISGKRKSEVAESSKDKPSNERMKRNTYKSPWKLLRTFGLLSMLLVLFSIPVANGDGCERSKLSDTMSRLCIRGPHIKNRECCLPLLTSIDETGGVECLCALSLDSKIKAAGFTYEELIELYSTCGGLNEDLAQQASCRAEAPARISTPPPRHFLPPATKVSSAAPPPPVGGYPLLPPAPGISSAPPPPSLHANEVVEWPSNNPIPPDFPTSLAIRIGEAITPVCLYYATNYFAPWINQAIINALIWMFRNAAKALWWLFTASLRAIKRFLKPVAIQRQTEMVPPSIQSQNGRAPAMPTLPGDVP